jgi:chromosomal replication initiation ATPase DnaA
MAFERDHSSVIHAYRTVAMRKARDEEFAKIIEARSSVKSMGG